MPMRFFVRCARRARSRALSALMLPIALAAFAAPLHAQELAIYAPSASNNQLSLVNFDSAPNVVAVNIDANERKSLRSIVIREDQSSGVNLILADTLAAEVLWYADPLIAPAQAGQGQLIGSPSIAPGPALPDGLSLNPNRDLFAVSSGTGNASQKTAELWVYPAGCVGSGCRPGGYSNPVKLSGPITINIAGSGPAVPVTLDLLEETRVATATTGSVVAGDLLILSSQPAALIRLPGAGAAPLAGALPVPQVLIYPDSATGVPARKKFPAGAEPGGFAFAPGGRLLVTTSTGSVLSYDTTGLRAVNASGAPVDFASGLGNGKFKIAVAVQRGIQRALIANRNGGELVRFDISTAPTGQLSGSVKQGLQFPVAVAATNSNVVATPLGLGITSSPTRGILSSRFQQVSVPGFTSGIVYLVPDPVNRATSPNQSFVLSDFDATLPSIQIPGFLRGLPMGGPTGSPEAYVVVIQTTSATYEGPVVITFDVEPVLGWNPPCPAHEQGQYWPLAQRERSFWGPIAQFGENPIQEGATVINVTDGCINPSKGLVRESSIFVQGRDTRTAQAQTSDGLNALGILLSSPAAQTISKSTLQSLKKFYDTAVRDFSRSKYADVSLSLLALAATADTVTNAPRRVGFELESRARATAFAVCSVEQPVGTPVCSIP
jgi:hypothetical protein